MKSNVVRMENANTDQEGLPLFAVDELNQIRDMIETLAQLVVHHDSESTLNMSGLSYLFDAPLEKLNALIYRE